MTADVLALLNAAAARYNVPPALAIAVANQESGGNQFNSSGGVLTSSAGAMGVMQLEPATAAGLGVDPTDTAQNIDGGVRYLSQLLNQFNGDQSLALAAYNWGPGNISKNGLNNWPTETVNYVSSILSSIGNTIASPFIDSSASTDPSSSPDPGTGNIVALAIVGGLVLWGLTRALAS
jgi:soluble lytic murein transglycosylase-like protein